MLHPDTVLRTVNDEIGVGVFATRRIERGTLTWVADGLDQRVPDAQVQRMEPAQRLLIGRYAWQDQGSWVLCWDLGKFVNHHCEPTSLGVRMPWEVAVRDIEEGEEITDDYRTLGHFVQPFECHCGAPTCGHMIRPGWNDELITHWRGRMRESLQHLAEVPQPLMAWMTRDRMATLTELRTTSAGLAK